MRAHRALRAAIPFLATALLFSSAAFAQRRVVLPPGAKAPAVQPAAPTPAASPAATQPAAAEPQPAPPLPAPKAALPPTAEPAVEAKPASPEPPKLLVPKDEIESKAAKPSAAAAASAEAPEVVYRRKVDRTMITLRVRPGKPVPGRATTLVVDVVRQLPVPDPTLGDRAPLEGATLVASLGFADRGEPRRFWLHPLEDAGSYGMHFTALEPGLYRLTLEQRLEAAEIGEVPLTTEFLLGFGVPTPMGASEEDDAVKVSRGRRALRVVSGGPKGPNELMKAMGGRWVELTAGLEAGAKTVDLEAQAKAIAELAGKLPGQVPVAMVGHQDEFDALAKGLAEATGKLPQAVGAPEQARAQMTRMQTDSCFKCHAKYRFRLTEDLHRFPDFPVKPPASDARR